MSRCRRSRKPCRSTWRCHLARGRSRYERRLDSIRVSVHHHPARGAHRLRRMDRLLMTRTPVDPIVGTIKVYIGIDPGLSGVVAVMIEKPSSRLEITTHRTPTMHVAKKSGKGKVHRYNLPAMLGLLKMFTGARVIAGLEELSGRPGQ